MEEEEEEAAHEEDAARFSVPVDTTQPTCVVCGDDMDKHWDDEHEQWQYTDTVRIASSDYADQYRNFVLSLKSDVSVEAHIKVIEDKYRDRIVHTACFVSLLAKAKETKEREVKENKEMEKEKETADGLMEPALETNASSTDTLHTSTGEAVLVSGKQEES